MLIYSTLPGTSLFGKLLIIKTYLLLIGNKKSRNKKELRPEGRSSPENL